MTQSMLALSGFESQLQQLTNNRQQSSDQSYTEGMRLLFQAKESNFQDRQALKSACDLLLKSIQKNRQNVSPYISVAYILMLLADHKRASKYLRQALRLDPQNENANNLLECIQEVQKIQLTPEEKQATFISRFQQNPQIQDYGVLYEQTEKKIKELLLQLMRTPHSTQAVLEPDELEKLSSKHSELKHFMQHFESQFKLIEHELNTSALYVLIRPLETLLKRYQQAIHQSQVFMQMIEQIEGVKRQTLRLINELQLQHRDIGSELEPLLDFCDAQADQLDDLEHKKINITLIKPFYKQLIEHVSLLQDLYDEKFA